MPDKNEIDTEIFRRILDRLNRIMVAVGASDESPTPVAHKGTEDPSRVAVYVGWRTERAAIASYLRRMANTRPIADPDAAPYYWMADSIEIGCHRSLGGGQPELPSPQEQLTFIEDHESLETYLRDIRVPGRGYRKGDLAAIGISWPPPAKWKDQLLALADLRRSQHSPPQG